MNQLQEGILSSTNTGAKGIAKVKLREWLDKNVGPEKKSWIIDKDNFVTIIYNDNYKVVRVADLPLEYMRILELKICAFQLYSGVISIESDEEYRSFCDILAEGAQVGSLSVPDSRLNKVTLAIKDVKKTTINIDDPLKNKMYLQANLQLDNCYFIDMGRGARVKGSLIIKKYKTLVMPWMFEYLGNITIHNR